MEININCDLGEKSKHHSNKYDPDLLGIVNSANVACGYQLLKKLLLEPPCRLGKAVHEQSAEFNARIAPRMAASVEQRGHRLHHSVLSRILEGTQIHDPVDDAQRYRVWRLVCFSRCSSNV